MSDGYGRCPLCGGAKAPGTTTFAVDLQFGVVVIREVPALVCSQCGDAWIEDAVVERLETVTAEARRKKTVVEVARWTDVAA
jgi:YgiT-type zinc finger domain-containing protein